MIKVVSAVLDGGPAVEALVATAATISSGLAASLDAISILPGLEDSENIVIAASYGAVLTVPVMDEETISERRSAIKSAFDRYLAGSNSAQLLEYEGAERELVASFGKVTDLLIMARPGSDPLNPAPGAVHAALFDTGCPVLVAPTHSLTRFPERAVVAWNDTVQAAKALHAALPILGRVKETMVVTLGHGDNYADTNGVLAYLERHGIQASAQKVDVGGHSSRARGRALLRVAQEELKGDILVMGAYGHSSISHFLGLGGATEKVITANRIPVLLAH